MGGRRGREGRGVTFRMTTGIGRSRHARALFRMIASSDERQVGVGNALWDGKGGGLFVSAVDGVGCADKQAEGRPISPWQAIMFRFQTTPSSSQYSSRSTLGSEK